MKIFRLRNRILSPQQFAQIQSDFVYPNPQTRWLCRMEVQVCVRLPPPPVILVRARLMNGMNS